MLVFWRLLLGHLLADFTLQFNFINSWKRRSLWGMLAHVGTHPALYVLLTWGRLQETWLSLGALKLPGWACIAAITGLHFLEDQWRVSHVRRHRSRDNTVYFLWDQGFHWACLFILQPAGLLDQPQSWIPERWPVILCLLIGATNFCGILIYFLEKDLFGGTFPEFDEKYMAMAERLVLVCCLLFPGDAVWLALAAAWIGVMAYLRRRRIVDFSWFSFYFGAAFAGASGLAARMIWYAG